MSSDKQKISAHLTKAPFLRLRKILRSEGRTFTWWLDKMVEEWLRKNGGKK